MAMGSQSPDKSGSSNTERAVTEQQSRWRNLAGVFLQGTPSRLRIREDARTSCAVIGPRCSGYLLHRLAAERRGSYLVASLFSRANKSNPQRRKYRSLLPRDIYTTQWMGLGRCQTSHSSQAVRSWSTPLSVDAALRYSTYNRIDERTRTRHLITFDGVGCLSITVPH